MASSSRRRGPGSGPRRAGSTARRSGTGRAAPRRRMSATRGPAGRGASGPAGDRPANAPASSAASGRRRDSAGPAKATGRRRVSGAVRSPLTRQIVALGLALCAVALSLAYPLRNYLQQQVTERQAVAEQQRLESRIDDLHAEQAALSDPAYIKAEAKSRLQYVSPGDTVYVVKVPGAAGPSPAVQPDAGPPNPGGSADAAGAGGADGVEGAEGAEGDAESGAAGMASDDHESTDDDESTADSGRSRSEQPDVPWYSDLWDTVTGDGATASHGG